MMLTNPDHTVEPEDYVLGFAHTSLTEPNPRVALIQKTKPLWQAGKWNGIGGKIEANETDVSAMCREFEEETGVSGGIDWQLLALASGRGWNMSVFSTETDLIYNMPSTTEERVFPIKILDALGSPKPVDGVKLYLGMILEGKSHGLRRPIYLQYDNVF